MKIKFTPQFLIEQSGHINKMKFNITKEYKVRDDVTNEGERLIKIKDDAFNEAWIPYEYKDTYFIVVEEENED